ncbi:MAG: hypothetical protein ACE5IP_08240 [Terriglobia bacterium]
MAHRVTLIPGDGIGPEVAAAARQGRHRTRDLGGTTSTTEFTDAVVAAVEQMGAGTRVRA